MNIGTESPIAENNVARGHLRMHLIDQCDVLRAKRTHNNIAQKAGLGVHRCQYMCNREAAARLLRCGLDSLVVAAVVVNPDRPGRVQPRVVKRRPLGYSRMTRPRAELKRELMRNQHRIT